MSLFKSKTTTPTHEERIQRAKVLAGNAVSVFHQAADDLEAASEEQDAIAAELLAESDRLYELAYDATQQREDAADTAHRIRSLLS